jgi:hypothetical protein
MTDEQIRLSTASATQKLTELAAEREALPAEIASLKSALLQDPSLNPEATLKQIGAKEERLKIIELQAVHAEGDILRASIDAERARVPQIEHDLESALTDEREKTAALNQAQVSLNQAAQRVLQLKHDLTNTQRNVQTHEIALAKLKREAAARLAV